MVPNMINEWKYFQHKSFRKIMHSLVENVFVFVVIHVYKLCIYMLLVSIIKINCIIYLYL